MTQAKPAPIDTAAKRSRLPAQRNPYWRAIGHGRGGIYLGYRRRADDKPGVWVGKLIRNKRRIEEKIADADDPRAKPGALSFTEASARVLAWAGDRKAEIERIEDEAEQGGAVTVGDAVRAYIQTRHARRGQSGKDAQYRLDRYVLADAKLSDTKLVRLRTAALKQWRSRLPDRLKPATVNRLLNDLRAALNAAIDEQRAALQHIRDDVKAGTKTIGGAVQAREKQVLSEADVRAIVSAALTVDETGDFGRLVLLLAATGARFSQLAALRVRDVQEKELRIMLPVSQKGRGQKSRSHVPVAIGPDVIEHLRPVMNGRKGSDHLLERWIMRQVGPVEWMREARGPWRTPSEMKRRWLRTLDLVGMPHSVVPYALRHTSIVRMLRANISTRFVALAHDTSVAMIEKHYAAHVLDEVAEITRRVVQPYAPETPSHLRAV